LRAPEAKMALMTPLIFVSIFGSMLLSGGMDDIPKFTYPFIGLSSIGMSLIGIAGFLNNMFGMDRHSFRAYVLAPARRRDILIGKNMGFLPFVICLSAVLLLAVQFLTPMRMTHLLATVLQIAVVMLSYFTISNYISIVAPIGMAFGSMKVVQPKIGSMLLQAIAAADWQAPPRHPDLSPGHEALLLKEQFREMLRRERRSLAAAEPSRPASYRQWLRESEAEAARLEESLATDVAAQRRLRDSLQRIGANCRQCHDQFRDVPLTASPAGKPDQR